MNAPDKHTPLAEPEVDLLPVDTLAPSRTHIQELRRKRFNPDALTDLAASLLKVGQLQPIVVRPWNPAQTLNRVASDPKHEIVLGERRWLACKQAGLAHIQASIRPLTDGEVLEAQLIENLQREDLHPLEEAEGYRELMAAAQLKKEDLGARIGKSRSWVYARLKLLDLLPATRDALEAGRIDVSRAMILARIGDPVHQARGLELAVEKTWDAKSFKLSVRALQDELGVKGFTITLRAAPFDTADPSLDAERGACAGCEFRSGNHDPEATDPDICTHRSCYEKKAKAAGARKLQAAIAQGTAVLRGEAAKKITAGRDRYVGYVDLDEPCEWDHFPEDEPGADDDAAWEAWRQRESAWVHRSYRQLIGEPPYPFAITLLEGKGKRVIELAPFKDVQKILRKQADIQLPASVAAKPAPQRPAYDYKAEQAKEEERRKKEEAAAAAERAWRIPVVKAIVAAKIKPELKGEELRIVAEAFFDDWAVRNGLKLAGYGQPKLDKATDAQIITGLRLAIACVDIASTDGPPTELLALAKAHKVDVARIKKSVEAKDKPTEKKGAKK